MTDKVTTMRQGDADSVSKGSYRCKVTGYLGYENDIVAFRNANRSGAKDRAYMDWRYSRVPGAPDALVFWLIAPTGQPVGMASLIFRQYWLNGVLSNFAVLGDISLNSGLRGKGLGQTLLQCVTSYIDEHSYHGFVIPNSAALQSLSRIDWKLCGKLVLNVLLLDPSRLLQERIRSKLIAATFSPLYRRALRCLLKFHLKPHYHLEWVNKLDESTDALWQQYAKEGKVLREMGTDSLMWRYGHHPHGRFKFAKLVLFGSVVGCVVYEAPESEHVCTIFDIIVKDFTDLACLLSMFALEYSESQKIDSIRIVFNDTHKYLHALWKVGFINRGPQGVFLIYWPNEKLSEKSLDWMISAGDKDV